MSEGKEQSRKTGEFPVQQSYSEIPRRKIKMATVKELLRAENDGTLSFGDYTLTSKTKKDNFEFEGDLYKVKTFAEITKLEKNGMFVYESVPGTTVLNLNVEADGMSFKVEGPKDAQITVELEEDAEYSIKIDDVEAGVMKTNLGGKLAISVELEQSEQVAVEIKKK